MPSLRPMGKLNHRPLTNPQTGEGAKAVYWTAAWCG